MWVCVICFASLSLVGCGDSSSRTAVAGASGQGDETEHAQGAEKIRLLGVTLTPPDYFRPNGAGNLEIAGSYEVRPTDAANGNAANRKKFWIIQTAVIRNDAGEAVRSLAEQVRVDIPPRASANEYYPQEDVVCVWDGRNEAGEMVPDGTYTWLVEARYVRLHDAGSSGRTQEHLVGVSNTISGAIVVATIPTRVVSTTPADNATNVPLDTKIRIEFSDSMDHPSTQTAFLLWGEEGSVDGDFLDWEGNTMVFRPSAPLADNTHYFIMLNGFIALDARLVQLDGDGDEIPGGYFDAHFMTENLLRTVVSTTPAEGATDVPLDTEIRIEFSDSMDHPSTQSAFLLWGEEGSVDGDFLDWVGNTMVFRPSAPLAANTHYFIMLNGFIALDARLVQLDAYGVGSPGGYFDVHFMTTAGAFLVEIPATSKTSPAFIEGEYWRAEDYPIIGNGPAGDVAADVLDERHFFVDIPLQPGENAVSVRQEGTDPLVQVTGQVTWTPTVIDTDSGQSVTIRKGDSLLLVTEETTGTLKIDLDYYGTFHVDESGPAGTPIPAAFDFPGEYTVYACVDAGAGDEFAGEMTVVVIEVDLSSPIACQVGYTREKYVPVRPYWGRVQEVHFGAVDPDYLGDMSVEYDDYGATIWLRALKRGTPVLTARIGGEAGPIAAYREVDEFTSESPAGTAIGVDADTGVGTTWLTMRPYIPDIDVEFDMFSPDATFAGGMTAFGVNTSDIDPETGEPLFEQVYDEETRETIGVFYFGIETPPGLPSEDGSGFTVEFLQAGSVVIRVGYDVVNGAHILVVYFTGAPGKASPGGYQRYAVDAKTVGYQTPDPTTVIPTFTSIDWTLTLKSTANPTGYFADSTKDIEGIIWTQGVALDPPFEVEATLLYKCVMQCPIDGPIPANCRIKVIFHH